MNKEFIPQIILDYGYNVLNENNRPEVREQYMKLLEQVKEYCEFVSRKYNKH